MNVMILVVDDEPDVEMLFRQQFRRDLKAGRFEIDFAFSAADALKHVASANDRALILILSDINMPNMSGLELLSKVKEARPDLAVIMITAYADSETRRKVVDAGADGFFSKPIDFIALKQEIDRRVSEKDGPS